MKKPRELKFYNHLENKTFNLNSFKAMLFFMNNKADYLTSQNLQYKFNLNYGSFILNELDFEIAYKFLLKKIKNLDEIKQIEVVYIYNAFTPFIDFYTPIYLATTIDNKKFKYFVFNKQIQITKND